MSDSGIDAILICTPTDTHADLIEAAVSTGKAVFCEKPVDLDSGRIRRCLATVEKMKHAGVPSVGVSFGGNQASESIAPLDWGGHIPLWHIERHAPDTPVVVVSPARDLDANAHAEAGRAIVRAARSAGRSIAFVASADQGHGHRADGPYGFAAESATFDARVVDVVRRGALEELMAFHRAEVLAALADSWWQMVMLHGALDEDGATFRSRLLAYEAPTYYGMLTAVFERAHDPARRGSPLPAMGD